MNKNKLIKFLYSTVSGLSPTAFYLRSSHAFKVEQYNLMYVTIPKVACTSWTSIIVDLLEFDLPEKAWKAGVFRSNEYDEYIDTVKRDDAYISLHRAMQTDGFGSLHESVIPTRGQ